MARFVIADDYQSWRDRNRAFLQAGGHEVIAETDNGKTAIELCSTLRPDGVLLDVSMPICGGDIAAREILAANTAAHVFVCSSATSKAVANELIALGAVFIAKPYHRPDFLQKIEAKLRG